MKAQGEEIFFHKDKKECDFVLRKGNQIVQAIQVTTHLSDQKVRDREIGGLLEAMNAYHLDEGLIITENDEERIEVEGRRIEVIPVWRWLLEVHDKTHA